MGSVQSMASSSSPTVPSSERTSHFTSQTESEMESSKASHWSQLVHSTDLEWSAETNFIYFDSLKKDPQWGRFFTDFETLEVGKKISEGAQAVIYEARKTNAGPFDLVVMVMKGNAPLQLFQGKWPTGMLSARFKYTHLFDLPLITILGGTVLRDERLRGRFAFVMYRRWGDLRLLIDRRMRQERSTCGPFPLDEAIHLMLSIAGDMAMLHDKHDIIHRDLKASNVLVWGDFKEDMSLVAPPNQVARIGSVVADFECSVGVLGTGFWRAPEILEQLKARVPSEEVQCSRASDVYSYAMTCYEIVTGCIPYGGLEDADMTSQILNGRRPELPDELPFFVRNMIVGCWHSNPRKRPTFSAICMALKLKRGPHFVSVVIDNKSQRGASIVKVEQWNNLQPLTLLEVMQELMDMNLSILMASDLFSTGMITHYFEVIDCKGKKVVKDKSIANIIKALSLSVKMNWISESLGAPTDGNTIMQMHVVEVVAVKNAGLLGDLSMLLVATNSKVHSARCWTREGRVECVMYMRSARTDTLLWELRHNTECFPASVGCLKISVDRVAAGELGFLNSYLHNLKHKDLTRFGNSSVSCVHQRKESGEGFCSTEVVVQLQNLRQMIDMSGTLAGMDYRIVQATIEYLDPYEIPKGRAHKSKDINLQTLGEDESEKIHRIEDLAVEHGCSYVKWQLVVSGPSEEVHNDLMRSFRENDLVVTGGQVYRDGGEFGHGFSFPSGDLLFFVTEKSATGSS